MINFLYYIIILFLCSVIPANAIDKSINVEWGYTPPSAPAVTGFKLYQEGTFDIYGRSIIELYELIVDMPKTSL